MTRIRFPAGTSGQPPRSGDLDSHVAQEAFDAEVAADGRDMAANGGHLGVLQFAELDLGDLPRGDTEPGCELRLRQASVLAQLTEPVGTHFSEHPRLVCIDSLAVHGVLGEEVLW